MEFYSYWQLKPHMTWGWDGHKGPHLVIEWDDPSYMGKNNPLDVSAYIDSRGVIRLKGTGSRRHRVSILHYLEVRKFKSEWSEIFSKSIRKRSKAASK